MTVEMLHVGLISPNVTAAPAQTVLLAGCSLHRVISVYLPVALLEIHF